MRTFFYFIPDRRTLTPAEAAQLGLAYAFDDGQSIDCTPVDHALDGQSGVVCAQQDTYSPGQCGYHKKSQTWRRVPPRCADAGGAQADPGIWVGYYTDAPPGPLDLARDKLLAGEAVSLQDGQPWIVPLARSYSERGEGDQSELTWTVQLPQRLDLAADGKWTTSGVIGRYAALWELAEGWLRVRDATASEADFSRFDFQGQIDGAVLALSANYRLSRVEAALLGLFSDELTKRVLDTLCDLETLLAWCKKKAMRESSIADRASPAGSASSAGPAAEILTTAPP